MGYGNTGEQVKRFNIVHGKWAIRVPAGTEGAVERELEKGANAGKKINELHFTYVDGTIVGGEFRTGQFTNLNLNVVDGDDKYVVQFPVPSDHFRTFGKCCENIDPTRPVFFGLGDDDGRAFLYIKQDGATIHSAYTKDDPKDCPPWEKKDNMGKVEWDKTEQNNFLYGKIVDFLASFGTAADEEPEESDPF